MLLALYLLMRFLPEIPLQLSALLAVLAFVPLLPLTLRLSRVMWLGIGHDFSPDHYPGIPPEPPAAGPRISPTDPADSDGNPVVDTPDCGEPDDHKEPEHEASIRT